MWLARWLTPCVTRCHGCVSQSPSGRGRNSRPQCWLHHTMLSTIVMPSYNADYTILCLCSKCSSYTDYTDYIHSPELLLTTPITSYNADCTMTLHILYHTAFSHYIIAPSRRYMLPHNTYNTSEPMHHISFPSSPLPSWFLHSTMMTSPYYIHTQLTEQYIPTFSQFSWCIHTIFNIEPSQNVP